MHSWYPSADWQKVRLVVTLSNDVSDAAGGVTLRHSTTYFSIGHGGDLVLRYHGRCECDLFSSSHPHPFFVIADGAAQVPGRFDLTTLSGCLCN